MTLIQKEPLGYPAVTNVKHLRLTLLLALGLLSFTPSVRAQVPSMSARVNLNVVDQELSEVVQFVRDRSGANIVILEGGDQRVRDLQVNDVFWRDALEFAVDLAGCVLDEGKSGVLTVSRPKRVSFDLRDIDLNEVIMTIAAASGANIIIGPEVEGTVRVSIKDVPWRDALEEIVRARGYTVVEERRNILRVVDPLTLEKQKVTRSYQLRYLRPTGPRVPKIETQFHTGGTVAPVGEPGDHFSALKALSKALSEDGELDFIAEQNVIIVRDTVQVHEALDEILRRLDVEPAQVFVDVKFVSTANTDLLDMGIDYGDNGLTASISGGQIPIDFPFTLGKGGFEDDLFADSSGEGPYADGSLSDSTVILPDTIFGALSFTQFQATLRMMQQDTSAEIIQAPKLVTMDGREATIFVGESVRYAEAKSEQGQAGGLQLTVAEAAGSPVEVGFQLLIRPSVVPGTETIIMEVIPKETSLAGTSGTTALSPAGFDIFTVGSGGASGSISLPRTRSSTLITQMMVESGQTAVIGGLTTDVDAESMSRVPFISRIPLLGELFKYRNNSRERRSLVIFITPRIVRSTQDTEYLLQKELERRRTRLHDEVEALVNPK